MLDGHPEVRVASDPLLPLLRSARDAAVAASVPGALPRGAPFQDAYYQHGPRAALDALLDASPDLPVDAAELSALREALRARAAHEEPGLSRILRGLHGRTHGELVRAAFAAIATGAPGAAVAGTKEVWALDTVPFLARVLPGLRVVVVRRDPRAIVASNLGVGRLDAAQVGHPFSVVRHWRKQEALLAELPFRGVRPESMHVVRYEDVVRDSLSASHELAGFLGVAPAGDLGAPGRLRDRSGRAWTANSSFGVRGPGVRSEHADAWRVELDRWDLAGVELIAGPEMARLGYRAEVEDADVLGESSLRALDRAHQREWGWRSDMGRPAQEHALEVRRRSFASWRSGAHAAEVRDHFLFASAVPGRPMAVSA